MSRKVTFVELPTFDGVAPLVSGYMEAVCRKDPMLVKSFQFEKISNAVDTPYTQILSTLEQNDADVYAFSCYVWNSGMVRRLLGRLLKTKPRSYFILGGPQVMHQAVKYLSPDHENVFVCNGEGERTFANFLRALLSPNPDFTSIRGLSFYHDKQLVTTEAEPRIIDLSEIPSPFLEGLFERDKYNWVIIETNRGCPFKCSYCYWGAAIGARVYRYDIERIKREIEWISQSNCWYMYIADANWGMLKRDVDLSQFIVDCQKHTGVPIAVHFCGSKNTPDRVSEITRIFHEGGLIASQSVALQTMNSETLKRVGRENIKTSAYVQVQQALNQHEISSFIEIMWPLPGETLFSFQEGLAMLCENGADSFSVYNVLLMNNVELSLKKDEYGIVTLRDPDPNSEAEIIVQTNEVDAVAFKAGMRYVYAVTCLYTLRGLWYLGRYLHNQGIMKYAELFRSFVDFCWRESEHPWTSFAEKSISALDAIKLSNSGPIIHFVLHEQRDVFDELLEKFVSAQEFWGDPLAHFFFEIDLINRPYIYRNTPIAPKRYRFTKLHVSSVLPEGYVVDIPPQYIESLRTYIVPEIGHLSTNRFVVDHRRMQLPFFPDRPLREHFVYCFDKSQSMRSILPLWHPDEKGLR
jgi:tRNA A37 methylthiotransferase MiaB